MIIRGGTSRGAYFHVADLPEDQMARDALLLRAMGGPDDLQVDGIGGGHPLTSKVAIVSESERDQIDVDYLFLQIDPTKQTVSDGQNCGNILAGVGLYAIEAGLVAAIDPITLVRVHMVNTGAICHLEYQTPGGVVQTDGNTCIDGVPATAAPIVCNYLEIVGAACGALLPTGNVIDEIEGVAVTCVDNGMPVVAIRAVDLDITGYETPAELDDNETLKARLESIRLQAGPRMQLGDVTDKTVPKMCLMSPATRGGLVNTRTFIPHVCHQTIGVLGAISAASACLLPGSAVAGFVSQVAGGTVDVLVEHPQGGFAIRLNTETHSAGVIRTGRIIFKGEIHV